MIKAKCYSCGAELGTFKDKQSYLEWRRQTESCENCGADLDTSLYTGPAQSEEVNNAD